VNVISMLTFYWLLMSTTSQACVDTVAFIKRYKGLLSCGIMENLPCHLNVMQQYCFVVNVACMTVQTEHHNIEFLT